MRYYATLAGLVVFLCTAGPALGQQKPTFRVEVSTDSVLLGHHFRADFILENAPGGEFSAPDFIPDFTVLAGPNMSSSFSMLNGAVTQKVTYTFLLQPAETGIFYLQPASIALNGDFLETSPVEILVVPNPDQLPQPEEKRGKESLFGFGSDLWNPFDFLQPTPQVAQPVKKKRKTYKL